MDRVPVGPYGLVHLGDDWGGWVLPGDLVDASWACYCVGAGSDISFDLALIDRFGARVRCVDPFRIFREQAEVKAGGDPRFTFHEVALAVQDGPLTMFGAEDPESGSLSAANLYRTDRRVEMPGRTLSTLMAECGDSRIDLLKLDIEGSEYSVLPTLDLRGLGVKVLCVELHPVKPIRAARRLLGSVLDQGYALVYVKRPASYTFVATELCDVPAPEPIRSGFVRHGRL